MSDQNKSETQKDWKSKTKGFLKKAFEIHSHYLFPFSRKAILPTAFCSMFVSPVVNTTLFPSAENFGNKYDIPEHAVTELTGNVYTVVRSGLPGRISQAYDFPPLVSLWNGNIDFNNHIVESDAMPHPLFTLGGMTCRVTINGYENGMDAQETLGFFSRLMEEQIDLNWLSEQDQSDLNLFVFFHELRHCHPDNDATGFREGDADYHAIKMVEKLRPKSRIRNIVMTLRSLDRGAEHDTVLYLDDRLYRGGKTPTAEIKEQSKLARDFIASDIAFINARAERALPKLAARQVRIYRKSLQKVTR